MTESPVVQQASVTATSHPLVAQYSVTTTTAGTVSVQFGPTTSYGFTTSSQPVPSGGGDVNILVGGMKQNTMYHMQAVITDASGNQTFDTDRTFQTQSLRIRNVFRRSRRPPLPA